jgi:hypothetical protein
LRAFQISLYFCWLLATALSTAGCYSFTGASVPQHWKSIAIPLFDDESGFGQPALRETVTNELILKTQRDNTLQIADRATASVELNGRITAVEADQPIAVSEGAQASRLQIVVKTSVTLTDKVRQRQVWSKTFTASGTYAPSGGATERDAALNQAVDKLTDDILLETISAW